jgi:hypothetical protein
VHLDSYLRDIGLPGDGRDLEFHDAALGGSSCLFVLVDVDLALSSF